MRSWKKGDVFLYAKRKDSEKSRRSGFMKHPRRTNTPFIVWFIVTAIIAVVLIITVILIAFGFSQALTCKVPDEGSLTWDPVTTLTGQEGTPKPIPETDRALYEVYLASASRQIADHGDVNTLIHQGLTETTQLTVQFPSKGDSIAGHRGFRVIQDSEDNEGRRTYLTISWTDDPGVVAPDTEESPLSRLRPYWTRQSTVTEQTL
jgi:hypothetical protein